MSAAKVSSAAGSPKDAPSARPELRIFPRTPVGAVIVTATLLALGLRVYQITRPGVLLGEGVLPRGLLDEGVPSCAVTTVHNLDVIEIASVAHLWGPL